MSRRRRHIHAGPDEWVVVHRNQRPPRRSSVSVNGVGVVVGVIVLLLLLSAVPGWLWILIMIGALGALFYR